MWNRKCAFTGKTELCGLMTFGNYLIISDAGAYFSLFTEILTQETLVGNQSQPKTRVRSCKDMKVNHSNPCPQA